MRVIITGGSGLIGSELAASLTADGYEPIILSRSPDRRRSNMPPGIRMERWDGKTAEGWGALANGAQAIVNLAGENLSAGRWTATRKRSLRSSRVNAGRAVVEAVEQAAEKPKIVIQSSAVGYYGPRGDELLTEGASPGPDFQSEVCQDWENSTLEVEGMGVRRAIIRSGVVLTLEGGALPRMLLPFRLFAGGPLGSGRQWFSWIHMADEVAAIRFLIEHPTLSGPFNLTAPHPVTSKEFSRTLGKVMGRPAIIPAPAFAIQLVFGEMSTVVLDGQRVIPHNLEKCGFTFQFSEVEPALRHLLHRG